LPGGNANGGSLYVRKDPSLRSGQRPDGRAHASAEPARPGRGAANGSISNGSTISWDFGPVGGGTVINTGVQDICPPGICDNFDLTVVLPAPAPTFYQTTPPS